MKIRYALQSVSLILLFLATIPCSAQQTLSVTGRHITLPCGDTILLRGINKMSIWKDPTGEKTIAEMAKTGANSIRIVWAGTGKGRSGGTKGSAEDLDQIMTNCINEGMIPIPECHDATGDSWFAFGEVVDYWTQPDIVQVIKKHEAYSILNIANEAGVIVDNEEWFNAYKNAIERIRATGLKLPLMIDGDEWGQNTKKLFKYGQQLLELDPEHNLIFSFHPWWPSSRFGSVQAVIDRLDTEIDKSIELDLPLIVGEFSYYAPGCDVEIPHNYIMETCHKKKISWLVWSWGPGNGDCRDMDMTTEGTFASYKHSGWSEDVLSGPFGLQRTSKKHPYFSHNGECPPYCQIPELPESILICDVETIILKNTTDAKHYKSTWTKDGIAISTEHNLSLSEVGVYQLETDSSGCKKLAKTVVIDKIPEFNLPSNIDLCGDELPTLTVKTPLANVTYNWSLNGKKISKGEYFAIEKEGLYTVNGERNGCTQTSPTITVESPYLIVKDKTIPFESEVLLKAKGGSGNYGWYYSPKGGSPAGEGKTFTVTVKKTTTFYVDDLDNPRCKRTPLKVVVKG